MGLGSGVQENLTMKYSQVVKIAIESMRKERKDYAFDANLAKRFQSDQPSHRNALKKVTEIDEAIAMLRELPKWESPRLF